MTKAKTKTQTKTGLSLAPFDAADYLHDRAAMAEFLSAAPLRFHLAN